MLKAVLSKLKSMVGLASSSDKGTAPHEDARKYIQRVPRALRMLEDSKKDKKDRP